MNTDWHILGAGAMGGLFAQRLAGAGFRPILLSRSGQTGSQPLTFHASDATLTEHFDYQAIHESETIRRLWVCTKSFDIVGALQAVLGRLAPDAHIVLMANGMGYQEQVAALLTEQSLFVATTTAGCYRSSPQSWVIAGAGETHVGGWQASIARPTWASTLTAQPWHCVWEQDMSQLLLKKLAINCAINPPTALWDITNGDLLSAAYAPQFHAAIAELTQVFQYLGNADLAAEITTLIPAVARQTATNTSSMRADVQHCRPTEIEAILGFLVEQLIGLENSEAPPATPILHHWLNSVRRHESAIRARPAK